jgi:NAD(P)-dependent dehydrogenase (short-subunit alcohol dehydrogenase family)
LNFLHVNYSNLYFSKSTLAMLLAEKVIVVTGGASGIGYECVKAYLKEGARVAVLDIRQLPAERYLQEVQGRYLDIACNVTIEANVAEAFQQIIDRWGTIDCIHNNAAVSAPSKALHETSVAEWNSLMDTNLFSIYLTTKFGIPHLKRSKGCIINTSSMVGEIGQDMHAAYAATKGAINALTKSMALDYAPMGIRVNAVAPAGVWTPMLKQWAREQLHPEEIEKYLDEIHPLGYCPFGDVVADVCVFLASKMSRFMTGAVLPVSGGAELGYKRDK